MKEKDVYQTVVSRWLQCTSAVFYFSHFMIHLYTSVFLCFLFFWTDYWPLVLLSICWNIYDRNTPFRGGRQSWLVKHLPIWRYFREYFPATLVKTADLDPRKNYIFCTHPHGFFCAGNNAHFILGYSKANELFPGLKFHTATLNSNFWFPFIRDYGLALGFISASRSSLEYLLNDRQRGNVVNLIIGGSAETIYINRGEYRIVLKRRKGFVKVALSTGCCLVPVFTFGENDCMNFGFPGSNWFLSKIHKWFLNKTRESVGCSDSFRFWPRRVPLNTVVGKPIEIPKVSEPTQEEIDHYHGLYTEALMTLFNEHKHKYVPDPENTDLMIVE